MCREDKYDRCKQKKSDFATPYTVSNALTKGGAAVKLSALIMGLGNIAHKQISKV